MYSDAFNCELLITTPQPNCQASKAFDFHKQIAGNNDALREVLLVSDLHKQLQLESCRRFVLREQINCGNFEAHKAFNVIQYLFCFIAEMLQKLYNDGVSLGFVQVQRDVDSQKVNKASGFTAFTDAGMHLNVEILFKMYFLLKSK